MKLKKATAVDEVDLQSFMTEHEHIAIPRNFNRKTSYVIEEYGAIISWFQLEVIDDNIAWLKKLFIIQQAALQLPRALQTIIQFANERNLQTIYVHSKQPVTDLLLSSCSFTLQSTEQLELFQQELPGNWWYYSQMKTSSH